MTCALTDEQMLTIWERGLPLGPTERALLVISIADSQVQVDEASAWPLGKRDARLLELREATFGETMRCCASCPRCRADVEFDVAIGRLRQSTAPDNLALSAQLDGLRVRARFPTSEDMRAVERLAPDQVEACLWDRCIVVSDSDGLPVPTTSLDVAQRARIETLLDEADPLLDLCFDLACTECGLGWLAPSDIARATWSEVARCAQGVLAQVDTLARSYGWPEREILSLSRRRREMYLAMLEH